MRYLFLYDTASNPSLEIEKLIDKHHPDAVYNLAHIAEGPGKGFNLSLRAVNDERLQSCFLLEDVACCLGSPDMAPRIAQCMIRNDGRVVHDGLFALAYGQCLSSDTLRLFFAYHDGPSWVYQVGKNRSFAVIGRSPDSANAVLLDNGKLIIL